jgi:hypothetical protein
MAHFSFLFLRRRYYKAFSRAVSGGTGVNTKNSVKFGLNRPPTTAKPQSLNSG